MATVAAYTSIASTAVGAYSAFSGSSATKANYEYQARLSEKNAEIAAQNVESIHEDQLQTVSDYREKISQTVGSSRASLAAQGFTVNDDADSTAWNLQQDIRDAGANDIMKIKKQFESEKEVARMAGESQTEQAQLYTKRAGQESPLLSSISQGASQAASVYKSGKQVKWWE
jgi:Skp family chaperone for outer membrane proteins